jgi:hypothetical protein
MKLGLFSAPHFGHSRRIEASRMQDYPEHLIQASTRFQRNARLYNFTVAAAVPGNYSHAPVYH